MNKFFHGVLRTVLVASTLLPIYLRYLWLWLRHEKLGWKVSADQLNRVHRKSAAKFYRLAVRMRGGMIKVGQIISTRVDIMPMIWTEELSKLQDSVDPCPWPVIKAHMESEYGRSIDDVFESVDPEAVAAASFGQVHRAVTKNGDELALKVRYPDIVMKLSVDLFLFGIAVPMFNIFVPKIKLKTVYAEMRQALEAELDYKDEATNTALIHDNLSDLPHIHVPKVFNEFTTSSIIATEFFHGHKITDKARMKELGVEPVEILKLVLHAWTRMMYLDGVFQSDPHPGNLFFRVVDGTPEICIIDFGQVKRLPPDFHNKLVNSVMAFMSRDADKYGASIVDMGLLSASDVESIQPMIQEFFDQYYDLTPAEAMKLDFDKIRADVKEFIRRIDAITVPNDLVLYGRTFSLLAGLATSLDKNQNALQLAKPIVMSTLAQAALRSAAAPA